MIDIRVNGRSFLIEEEFKLSSVVYQHQEHINGGGNSSVECFVNRDEGKEYAVKIIPLESDNNFQRREIQRVRTELDVLTQIKHDHVVAYYGYKMIVIKKRLGKDKFKDVNALFIIMERADCNLKDYICQNKIDYASYSGQILGLCDALNILHSVAIHRDLKPENILIVNSSWVISDFGLCTMINGSSPEITSNSKAIGPKYWLSPEALSRYVDITEHRKEITYCSDIYQMCAIFWFVINRKHPSGVLSFEDFSGPRKLYEPIFRGLQHDSQRRYVSTDDFVNAFQTAILEPS